MSYPEEEYLLLSGIQHFSFCRRQWALIHIEKQWVENVLTAEGRAGHKRVHEEGLTDYRSGVMTMRGMQIRSARLGLVGVCDAVEFVPDENGINLQKKSGKWAIFPVEYKHGKSKVDDCDRVQVAAQAMCLEEMFCCEIPVAFIFYKETGNRERVLLNDGLRNEVIQMADEMHKLYSRGHTPKAKKKSYCANCSLADICLPDLFRSRNPSVTEYIGKHLKEDDS